MSDFKKELEILINKFSMENESNTPDFMLAQYLYDCLQAFNHVMKSRDKWYDYMPGKIQVTNKNVRSQI